jgi:hypothetical protein
MVIEGVGVAWTAAASKTIKVWAKRMVDVELMKLIEISVRSSLRMVSSWSLSTAFYISSSTLPATRLVVLHCTCPSLRKLHHVKTVEETWSP